MPNHQYTSLVCLGAVLALSSGVGVRHAFVFEQVQTEQTTYAFKSYYQHLEGDSALTWQAANAAPSTLARGGRVYWCVLLAWLHCSGHAACNRAICDNGVLCNNELQ